MTSIGLPDGTQYSFTYDTGTSGNHLGTMTSVTLPTGGQLVFNHGYAGPAYLASATFLGGTWQFSYSSDGSGNTLQQITTVTEPSRYDATLKSYVNDKTVYTSVPGGTTHIQTVQHYSGSSTPLKTLSYVYPLPYGYGCLSSFTTTLNDTGQSSKLQYQYLSTNLYCSLITQRQEYDFGASSPTRTTKIAYSPNSAPPHGVSFPSSVSVYAGSGTGSPVSQTNYTYDEYSASYCKGGVPMLTSITGALNHDDSGHGASFTARGNVTSISGLISGTTYSTAHKCYDTLGNMANAGR